jgi:hypothetical protein
MAAKGVGFSGDTRGPMLPAPPLPGSGGGMGGMGS